MHDFACSRNFTIFLNLPLTLSPFNMLSWPPRPMIHFDRNLPSEFIIMPRRTDDSTKPIRFIDPEPSMIFHTANAWDEQCEKSGDAVIDMVACRFKSAKLVYAAGAVAIPAEEVRAGFDDVVRLHYYRFLFESDGTHRISHNFPLSEIPFEFPATHPSKSMSKARFVYGCSMREGGFDERLGGAAKVDVLVKVDVIALSEQGRLRGEGKAKAVDQRTVLQILEDHKNGRHDDIQVFIMPPGWYAQESRFVPRNIEGADEDDGWLLTYGMSRIGCQRSTNPC
jgi:carotenoid cleavage dioxygenase-like enzyme